MDKINAIMTGIWWRNSMHQVKNEGSFRLTGTLQAITYFTLNTTCCDKIHQQMLTHKEAAPKLLDNALTVLDFQDYHLDITKQELQDIINLLSLFNMSIIGHSNTTKQQQNIINQYSNLKQITKNKPKPLKSNSSINYHKTFVGPIRSGQQLQNIYGDIVIIGSVNSGAEIIAAGSIHVYGKLSGSCIAGSNNNKSAMIFCQALNPELISIAGNYQKSTQIKSTESMCIIHLDKSEKLIFSSY